MWFQDVRHGFRALRRRPGFSLAAALTLAIGIGATTVIYSTLRAVLWRPLPYPAPPDRACGRVPRANIGRRESRQ
jgi:hypothetical protein